MRARQCMQGMRTLFQIAALLEGIKTEDILKSWELILQDCMSEWKLDRGELVQLFGDTRDEWMSENLGRLAVTKQDLRRRGGAFDNSDGLRGRRSVHRDHQAGAQILAQTDPNSAAVWQHADSYSLLQQCLASSGHLTSYVSVRPLRHSGCSMII